MPLTRFTLRQIETFVVAADLHSFSAAAERLGMTAQAVSQLVLELEGTLGFRLFDRTTRKVDLSGAGRDFLAPAQSLLRHARAAESAAADVRHRAAGIVRVGAPLVLAATALPAAIRAYRKTHPKVAVRVRDVAVEDLVLAVAAGDVDLAIGPDRATGAAVRRDALFETAWVLFCAPDHRLARATRVRWSDLRCEALVAAGHDHEQSVAQMRASTPEEERVAPMDVVDNISTALGIAAEGLAVTLGPAYVHVLAQQLGLVMRKVLEPDSVRKVCLYCPVERALSPAAHGFSDHLRAWLPQWAARLPAARRTSRGTSPT